MAEEKAPFTGGSVDGLVGRVKSAQVAPGGRPVEGKYAEHIGSGDNARNSFIYITITWSFLIGVGTSFFLFMASLDCKNPNVLDDIKGVWAVFMPVITLALGYAFGKGR